MKVIIAGGRDFVPTVEDRALLRRLHAEHAFAEVVSGGAMGADVFGEKWARRWRIPIRRFSADWKQYGRAAGPIRNRQMAEYADALIAFRGGRGTASMVAIAKELGLRILHDESGT